MGSLIVTYCARPGYNIPWFVMAMAICSDKMMHVPPLNLVVIAENEPSFQRLVPFLNSIFRACLRLIKVIWFFVAVGYLLGGGLFEEVFDLSSVSVSHEALSQSLGILGGDGDLVTFHVESGMFRRSVPPPH